MLLGGLALFYVLSVLIMLFMFFKHRFTNVLLNLLTLLCCQRTRTSTNSQKLKFLKSGGKGSGWERKFLNTWKVQRCLFSDTVNPAVTSFYCVSQMLLFFQTEGKTLHQRLQLALLQWSRTDPAVSLRYASTSFHLCCFPQASLSTGSHSAVVR